MTSLVLSDSLRDFPFQSSRHKHGSIFILICHTPFQVYQCLGSSSRRKEKKNRILSFPGGSQLLQLVRKVFFIRVLGSCGPSLLFLLVAPLALDCLEARVWENRKTKIREWRFLHLALWVWEDPFHTLQVRLEGCSWSCLYPCQWALSIQVLGCTEFRPGNTVSSHLMLSIGFWKLWL